MSQPALSNIEREKRSARPATIHRIARALRVPVAAITRDYDEMEGPAALSKGHKVRRSGESSWTVRAIKLSSVSI